MPEINEYGQQVNDLVPGWQGAQVLRRTALNGRFCRLEPLDVDRHAADLFAAYALGDNSDWTWLASTRPESVAATAHWSAIWRSSGKWARLRSAMSPGRDG